MYKKECRMKHCQICDPKKKLGQVMHECKDGKLHGRNKEQMITNRKQAVAIAVSENKQKCTCKKNNTQQR